MAKQPHTCCIEQVGKQRNGRPRYWCSAHQASATGRYGARLEVCEAAYLDQIPQTALELDPQDYPAGIALWGAVAPVIDTTGMKPEVGIHVHARKGDSGKEIDATFDQVAILYRSNLLETGRCVISAESAVAYYISSFLQRGIKQLHCSHCGEIHLDKGFFAVKPHRRHLCHGCGRYFSDNERGISNPIAFVRAHHKRPGSADKPTRPNRPLEILQSDYPGGIQIWASNPALLWTADRSEEEGIHVHTFSNPELIAIDETYSSVTIDGVILNEAQVQYLMVQQALPYLANKITALTCPKCDAAHFDQGELAFFPHKQHICENCGAEFSTPGRRRLVVSNPFVKTRNKLVAQR